MQSTVEPLEGNKVKLTVTIDESEFDKDITAAFKRIATEVNLPGFRRGKAPRKLLEARLGAEVGREEALRTSLSEYYAKAVVEHDVDVIAAPEIDITDGQEAGPVVFDATVEVRPVISVAGYDNLQITIPSPEPTDDELDQQIDRMRKVESTLATVERPAEEGDHVTIDIAGTLDGEPDDGLTAEDYDYEVGSGLITPEVDDQLTGASAGDELTFDATHPDEDEERSLSFTIAVKEVRAEVLPELTDEWAKDNSEFETVAEMRADMADRMRKVRLMQGQMQIREKTAQALADLVDDDAAPESLVNMELNNRLQDLGMRLEAQGMGLEQYLQMSGQTQESFLDDLRNGAAISAKVDLALRAVIEAEKIECTDDELDAEIEGLAERVGEKVAKVRRQLEQNEQLPAIRSDIKKRSALDWLIERVAIVDENGTELDRAMFEPEPDEDHDHDDSESDTAE